MTLLAMGLSHRTTPFAMLEQVSLDADAAGKLGLDLCSGVGGSVAEAVVVSTCNRVEVYAEVHRFHAAVESVLGLLSQSTGVPQSDLAHCAYVHYDDRAASHLFSLACGLDSVAIGEAQILGQVRSALGRAREFGTVGPVLSAAFRSALHVAKRAHSETALDSAARSLVDLALDRAREQSIDLRAARALVVGAGSMAAVATTALQRAGTSTIAVANRSPDAARRLLDTVPESCGGRAWTLPELDEALADADVVVCCTGAPSAVVTGAAVAQAMSRRQGAPQVYVDLALPRDVDAGVHELPGVRVIDLAALASRPSTGDVPDGELAAVRDMVAEEVSAFGGWQRARAVAPTVSALRARAEEVVTAELVRLRGRTSGMSDEHREEVIRAVRRVVDKLLHPPTVRLRESAASGDAGYAEALRTLFDLDAAAIASVSAADAAPQHKGTV